MGQERLGYLPETTFGENTINADTQLYKLGYFLGPMEMPSPKTSITGPVPLSGRSYGSLWHGQIQSTQRDFTFVLLNGIPIAYTLGDVSTSNEAGYYEHTITEANQLPSLSLHHEKKDESVREYRGVKCDTFTLVAMKGQPITASLGIEASVITQPATISDNAPILPPTANDDYFGFENMTMKWNDVNVTDIMSLSFGVTNGLTSAFVDRATNARFPRYIVEGHTLTYFINISVFGSTTFLTDFLAGQTRSCEIKISRGTHDFMTFTFATCGILSCQEIYVPPISTEEAMVSIGLIPKSCSLVVEDNIAGTYYP